MAAVYFLWTGGFGLDFFLKKYLQVGMSADQIEFSGSDDIFWRETLFYYLVLILDCFLEFRSRCSVSNCGSELDLKVQLFMLGKNLAS